MLSQDLGWKAGRSLLGLTVARSTVGGIYSGYCALPPSPLGFNVEQKLSGLKGEAARSVLIKGIAVDLHTDAFPVQAIAHTMVEHAGVLLHRVGPEAFELYVPRSYSANMWHWLTVSAEEFGYEVEG